ncbi:MAG: CpaF family protein [Candidatus Omnitrophica bacterium]|nr:CpaF family protein [Candidatus Omnitrophota bacterium]
MTKESLPSHDRLKTQLKIRLAHLWDGHSTEGQTREQLEVQLRQALQGISGTGQGSSLGKEEETQLIEDIIEEIVGFGPLASLLTDPTVTEIMVNGPDQIFVERNGKLQHDDARFHNINHLMMVIERILGSVGLTVNESNPLCDASLRDGSRINVIIPPLTLNGPVMTIRRRLREWTMSEFVATKALSQQAADFLQACVKAKINMVVSGGTSSGKTTLAGILSTYIPQQERVITIENVSELDLPNRQHWIRLVGRAPNLEGRGEISLRTLVRNALRMRPDRIILGEARGGEALDVVQAMHTGHDGVITVLHANSAPAALERLETLMLMSGLDLPTQICRSQIASALDIVIHMGRYADGSRRVATIAQVIGTTPIGFELQDLFIFEAQTYSEQGRLSGNHRYTGVKPKFIERFRLNNVEIPAWVVA